IERRQRFQHRLRAIDDPNDLAAPLERDLLAGLELGDILLDGCARRTRPLAREHRHHEWIGCCDTADSADDARRADEEAALPLVDLGFPHNPVRHCPPIPDCRCPSAPNRKGRRLANLSIIRDLRTSPEARTWDKHEKPIGISPLEAPSSWSGRSPDGALIILWNHFPDETNVARKLWLLFAQACTLCLAVLFVVATFRPRLLGRRVEP